MTSFQNAYEGMRVLLRPSALLLILLAAKPAAAQSVQILEPIGTTDRRVELSWTRAPGDTLTPAERQRITEVGFSTALSQGFMSNTYPNGVLLVGRGPLRRDAAGSFLAIGDPADLYRASSPPAPPAEGPVFSVVAPFQFGRNFVAVAYSQTVDPGTALTLGNYLITPSVAWNSARLQENGRTVILEAASDLVPGTSYSLTVNGVTNASGTSLSSSGPFGFDAPAVAGGVNIADIYANPAAFSGQAVAVFGQVTLATGARGGTADGFIQDGSGRGLRLFGGSVQDAVNSRANAAVVTGSVSTTGIDIQISGYTAAELATGLPILAPRILAPPAVLEPGSRGTLIQTQGFFSRVDASTDPEKVRYFAVTRDTLFVGYQVWRAPDERYDPQNPAADTTAFSLLRTYSLLDSTWTFVGDERTFSDPCSVVVRGTERDRSRDPNECVPGPFNGFGYRYAITWYDGVVDATVFPLRYVLNDTLRGDEGVVSSTVFPNQEARVSTPLLGLVSVIPNPYNPAAAFEQQVFPGAPRVQFVNLPAEALVKIYTASGDLVRELVKEPDPGNDSVVWDLKNADGRDVASGIYVYYVKSGVEEIRGHFVIAR